MDESADRCLQRARWDLKKDLEHLEEHIDVIKEILGDNMIFYEDPTKFFDAIKVFRERVRSIDVPPELSFIVNGSRKHNDRNGLLCPPGSVQRLETLIVDSAYAKLR